jgi:hypothetical protein
LLKSVASAAAVGAALTVAQLSTPATVTASPEIQTVACTKGYQGSIPTTISFTGWAATGRYGTRNSFTVHVGSNSKTPVGKVKLSMPGRTSWTVGLTRGQAATSLPRWLPAQATYGVTAKYMPSCDQFQGHSVTKHYTVYKAFSATRATVRSITRGHRPVVSVGVHSTGTPTGKVKVSLVKNGDVKYTETASLRSGSARVTCRKVWKTGSWTAKVAYFGSRNYKADTGRTTFTVKR